MNNTKISPFKRFSNFFFEEDNTSARKKIFSSLWAIVFGFIIASIFIASLGANPITVFSELFSSAISDLRLPKFFAIISVFLLAAIAVGVGFKASMFNIGVAGQMMAAGIVSFAVVTKMSPSIDDSQIVASSLGLFVGLLAGILAALLTGLVAGVLKAFLNINEVVTTILLNWIIFYICFQLLDSSTGKDAFVLPSGKAAAPSTKSLFFENLEYFKPWITAVIFVVTVAFAIGIWFVIKKTTLGYKIKMTGLNKDASKYSGTNEKSLIIGILGFSGIVAGAAGFVLYTFVRNSIVVQSSPEPYGFDSIAVSLLAHNSPIGSIFTSLLYAFLTTGADGLQLINSKLDQQAVQIVSGIIIYLAAISVVFYKFKPVSKFIKFIAYIRSGFFYKDQLKYGSQEERKYNSLMKMKNALELRLATEKLSEAQKAEIRNTINDYKELTNHLHSIENDKKLSLFKLKKSYLKALITQTNAAFDKLIAAQSDQQAVSKLQIKKLEREVLFISNFIDLINEHAKKHEFSLFKVYWTTKWLSYKKYKLSKQVVKLTNKENVVRWKELKDQLKGEFFKSASKNKMTENEKLELFRVMSEKRREINKELTELGYYDLEVLKEQYKASLIEYKAAYIKEKENIIIKLKEQKQWLRIEVI
ncbi:ABC transporter permease subunit [Mycoplasma procyoni]|uniref:ABC transporter permease subunit n=1 Tax=Mycoplasma procyoni TaxID=568784 RepID=UPI00197C5B7B|nr:hypothetical protein [Mycoplasma procyoni]MBN3534851.1 hypothetical protein [Mycoplasma procyoni]